MRNVLSVLLAVCICVSFASCSSGDYTATPGVAGTTIRSGSTTGSSSTSGSSSVTATINGTSFASASASVDTVSGELMISGIEGQGTSTIETIGIIFAPYNGVGNYTNGTNVSINYTKAGVLEAYTTGTATLTTASNGHYVGTFSASDGSNTLTNGKFDVHF